MIGASKILTVSYGTFSCTLEGFDEPFNTMKAIAEYFRDLAAEDRYFGAEPPTPDAAMLHRIAEREIQRRVEAKINEHGVILRAEELAPAALQSPAIAGQPAQVASPAPVQPATPVSAPAVAPALDAAGTDGVAARLARLRASQNAPEPVAAQPAPPAATKPAAPELYAEDLEGDAILSNLAVLTARAEAVPAVSYVIEAEDAADDTLPTDDIPFAAEAPLVLAPVTDPLFADDLPETADETAVVTEPETAQDSLPEDAIPADTTAEDAPQPAEVLAEIVETVAPVADLAASPDVIEADDWQADAETQRQEQVGETSEFEFDVEPTSSDDEATRAMLARFAHSSIDDAEEILADVPPAITDAPETAIETALDATEAGIDLPADESFSVIVPEDVADAVADIPLQPETDLAAELAAERAAVELAEAAVPAPATERLQRARARVIKIRRSEPQPDTAAEPATAVTGLLSPEAEAALQAELAALEADAPQGSAPQADAPVTADADADAPRPVRPVRPTASPDARLDRATRRAKARETAAAEAQVEGRKLLETDSAPEDVERLMAQTNSVMEGIENKRRHSAIAHLKAAVVATEADRQVLAANPGKSTPSRQDAYRLDLESVVRPGNADLRQPQAERPPLLVLVSEQRIDRPKPAQTAGTTGDSEPRVVMPTRPRRVGSHAATLTAVPSDSALMQDDEDEDGEGRSEVDENIFTEAQSFSDFAEKLGATSLHELLEASAVYCAQVLGCPQFSRTLVMQQLDSLPGAAASREDSLRVFGTLLREGRITKIRRNQFAVTDRSPILAEALRNAG